MFDADDSPALRRGGPNGCAATSAACRPPPRRDEPGPARAELEDLYNGLRSWPGGWVNLPAQLVGTLGPSAAVLLVRILNANKFKPDARGRLPLDAVYLARLAGLPHDKAERLLRRLANAGLLEVHGQGMGRTVRINAAVRAPAGGGSS